MEDLSTQELRDQIYMDRLSCLKEQLGKINMKELFNDITPEDLFDKFCDPEKPTRIQFNDISAAAYKIKGGVEVTPCTVKLKIKTLSLILKSKFFSYLKRSHMSSLTGMEIFFKKDFLQYTGSFKERGARYALLSLTKVFIGIRKKI